MDLGSPLPQEAQLPQRHQKLHHLFSPSSQRCQLPPPGPLGPRAPRLYPKRPFPHVRTEGHYLHPRPLLPNPRSIGTQKDKHMAQPHRAESGPCGSWGSPLRLGALCKGGLCPRTPASLHGTPVPPQENQRLEMLAAALGTSPARKEMLPFFAHQ